MKSPALKCAIYTRKSHEAGLEQEFNSLDAQREAAEAYIKSQAHEGWKPLKEHYDDGGFSGGNMDRPALLSLLEDVKQGRVNVVVVYKVDRLTRSLADFARLIEVFDEYGVSFVSVTQQFNTTSSMGRLTLNVLLSFAQFEREVTGERIRDKIHASKRKGIWMGGPPPLGYDVRDRKLIVNKAEAILIQHIFKRYIELAAVGCLKDDLDAAGHRSKRWTSRAGNDWGGCKFTRGNLYRILSNPLYLGLISHKGETFPGEHLPIIDEELWAEVQAQLETNRQNTLGKSKTPSAHKLKGKLFTLTGTPFKPTHACKGDKRYRYYVASEGEETFRYPAHELETELLEGLKAQSGITQDDEILFERMERVTLNTRYASVVFKSTSDNSYHSPVEIPIEFIKKGGETRIIIPGKPSAEPKLDIPLTKALLKGWSWRKMLEEGAYPSIRELANEVGVTHRYVGRLMRLGYLAPDIMESILDGTQPEILTLEELRHPFPTDWDQQRKLFGFI